MSLFRFQLSYLKHCVWFFIGNMIAVIMYSGITLYIPSMTSILFKKGRIDQYFLIMFMFWLLAFVGAFRYYCSTMLGERMVLFMHKDMFTKMIKFSPSFFNSKSHDEVFSSLVQDAERIKTTIGISMSIVLRNMLMFAGSILMMFIINFNLAIILIGVSTLIVLCIFIIIKFTLKNKNHLQRNEAKLLNFLSETIRSIVLIQSFNAEQQFIKRYEIQADETYRCAMKVVLYRTFIICFAVFAISYVVSMVCMLGAHYVAIQKMSGENLAIFVMYALIALGSIRSFSNFFGGILQSISSIKRLRDFMKCEVDSSSSVCLKRLPAPSCGSIAFRNVSFLYPSKLEGLTLKNIDFAVQPGETVALVGLSGAGKTSLFYLAMRFYNPCSGSIELDGVDLSQVPLEDIRQCITWIPQNPIIINASVHDNIAIGLPGATRKEVQRAAMAAQAHDFIICLDKSYDTVLGNNSVFLSMGQIQRIAIARAFLRDSPILLVDEMGSALDIENESKIWEMLREHRNGRTTIFISHRLSAIKKTDKVFVLHDGMICEKGTHDELVNKPGIYSYLMGLTSS